MAKADDITVTILKEIRDEIRKTNVRLDETRVELSGRISELSTGMGDLSMRMDRLEKRQVETEVRLATELVAVVGAVNSVRDAIVEDRRVRQTVEDHEARIRVLERRVG